MENMHSEDHLIAKSPGKVNGCENGVSDDASLNCAVTVSNGQEEMSPELQCCVEWLW
uniref:Uncharacterized protein n=1 Tax=Oncorhynchus mykiss TaxID=8022 RepID=A0A8C7WCV3_ONCMY